MPAKKNAAVLLPRRNTTAFLGKRVKCVRRYYRPIFSDDLAKAAALMKCLEHDYSVSAVVAQQRSSTPHARQPARGKGESPRGNC